jgi:RNA polymerase sigma-70 factor (ECF subfamily)
MKRRLNAARGGSLSELGRLLEACRPYLLLVANQELAPDLKVKVGASDLVQQTFLEAQQAFERFDGATQKELISWLRRILLNNVASFGRLFRDTDKRQLDREVHLTDSAQATLFRTLVDGRKTPSSLACTQERDEGLREALARLKEDYRQVIHWRNYERSSFEEIGGRLGRSADAARKLWVRAIEELQHVLESPDAT